jgi:hypothetical protein
VSVSLWTGESFRASQARATMLRIVSTAAASGVSVSEIQ